MQEITFRIIVLAQWAAIRLTRFLRDRSFKRPAEGWKASPADVYATLFYGLVVEASLLAYVFLPGALDWASVGLSGKFRLLGILPGAGALALTVWTYRALRQDYSPYPQPHRNHRLRVEGPYRHLRHPIYAAALLMALANAWISANWVVAVCWLGGGALFFAFRIPREEGFLEERFGDAYRKYRVATPALLPWLGSGARGEAQTVRQTPNNLKKE